jgi:hypothetical protein
MNCFTLGVTIEGKGKGKVHPRTGHGGPGGEQRYSSTPSLTSALDESGLSSRPGRFTPGKDPVPIVQWAGWASEPVWTGKENLVLHQDSIPIASRYTDYAIPAPWE